MIAPLLLLLHDRAETVARQNAQRHEVEHAKAKVIEEQLSMPYLCSEVHSMDGTLDDYDMEENLDPRSMG